jgi:hypothetical protein
MTVMESFDDHAIFLPPPSAATSFSHLVGLPPDLQLLLPLVVVPLALACALARM